MVNGSLRPIQGVGFFRMEDLTYGACPFPKHKGFPLCRMSADVRLDLGPGGALHQAQVIVALQIQPDFRGDIEILA